MTVRDLKRELIKVANGCEDYDLILRVKSNLVCCVIKSDVDENGDVCISVETEGDDGGYYTVAMLREELESYDEGKAVYWAGCGFYMTLKLQGEVFAVDNDSETVDAKALVIGRYEEEEEESGYLTIEDRRELAEAIRKQRRQNRWWLALLGMFTLLTGYILYCNLYEVITHTGNSLGSNIFWTIACPILLVIEVKTFLKVRKEL